ncbi:M15 family metallopeptidase [Rubrivirga sp.]|uniref:M15 family metallopeptidase n=1 Tax=Rubrivirga sp. TaxID=1885344 RepID=UPI003C7958DA
MSRSPVFPWLLAGIVGVALAAPSGCHQQQASAEPAVLEVEAPVAADTVLEVETVAPADTTERPALPEDFVRLSETAPEIAQEIRYTTSYNFVGEPITSYLAPECILVRRAAEALGDVARDLEGEGLGLKVYDCYRPQSAVRHFVTWANTPSALEMKDAFYPEEPKGELFSRGYIATRSGHSRGATVDLTLVPLPVQDAVRTDFPTPDGNLPRCDRPRTGPTGPDIAGGGRLHEGDLDMGTAYDCLSTASATNSTEVSAQARRNRQRLRAAMSRRGFNNYSKEWWHFTLRNEPHPRTHFDFPVE